MAMEQNLTLKTYMAIMAERDAAIREKNMALDERRRFFAERDMAMLQRDAAISEKDSALEERDKAISALHVCESSMNEKNLSQEGTNDGYHYPRHMQDIPWLAEAAYHPTQDEPIHMASVAPDNTAKPTKGKQKKEAGVGSSRRLPNKKLSGKGEIGNNNNNNDEEGSHDWENEINFGSEDDDDDERPALWRENSGLNQIMFDETVMPSPVCTCTGVPQVCYKWGNGGWQSICCCGISQSQTSDKRQSRMEGRKMTGIVFTQLLNQFASEGHDLSTPVDLANYWDN